MSVMEIKRQKWKSSLIYCNFILIIYTSLKDISSNEWIYIFPIWEIIPSNLFESNISVFFLQHHHLSILHLWREVLLEHPAKPTSYALFTSIAQWLYPQQMWAYLLNFDPRYWSKCWGKFDQCAHFWTNSLYTKFNITVKADHIDMELYQVLNQIK